jgi:DNA-binding winged helix-turn-helix (wHTH) protein
MAWIASDAKLFRVQGRSHMGTPTNATGNWRFGVFEFDAPSMQLRRAGVPIKLRGHSSRILLYLLRHAGQMVSREELRQFLWPSDTFVDFDHSLNTAVMKLREALGDSADKPVYIETIPKRGYRFVAPVSPSSVQETGNPEKSRAPALFSLEETSPDGIGSDLSAPPIEDDCPLLSTTSPSMGMAASDGKGQLKQTSSEKRSRKRFFFGFCAATLILFGIAYLISHVLRRSRDAHTRAAPAAAAPAAAAKGLRIVPLTSLPGRATGPIFSPDGEKFAFFWNGGNSVKRDLYTQLVGGEKPLRLTHITSGFICCADWSPDGRQIAFGRCDDNGGGVFVVPALGGSERKLTTVSCPSQNIAAGYPRWTADGRSLVMTDRCSPDSVTGVVVFSLDTGEKRCLDRPPLGNFADTELVLSPDKQTAAFIPGNQYSKASCTPLH